jgi:hypothetical protein
LKVVDAAGNVSCDTTTFSFDSLIEIPQLVTDKPLFSPNGDNFLDDIEISYEIDEYAIVDVKIFRLIKEAMVLIFLIPSRLERFGQVHNTLVE